MPRAMQRGHGKAGEDTLPHPVPSHPIFPDPRALHAPPEAQHRSRAAGQISPSL